MPFTTDPSRWYYRGEHRSAYTDKTLGQDHPANPNPQGA